MKHRTLMSIVLGSRILRVFFFNILNVNPIIKLFEKKYELRCYIQNHNQKYEKPVLEFTHSAVIYF